MSTSACSAASLRGWLWVSALLWLSGCSFCGDDFPCVDDDNCPGAVPFCVDGVCAANAGAEGEEGEGEEGEGEEGEGEEGEGDADGDLDLVVLADDGDGSFVDAHFADDGALLVLWGEFPQGELAVHTHFARLARTGGLVDEEADFAGAEPKGVAVDETGDVYAGAVDFSDNVSSNVVFRRGVDDGVWSAATPGPPVGYGSGFAATGVGTLYSLDNSISGTGLAVSRGQFGDTFVDEVLTARSATKAVFGPRRNNAPAIAFRTPETVQFLPFAVFGDPADPIAGLTEIDDVFCPGVDECWLAGSDGFDDRPLLVRADDDQNPVDLVAVGAADVGDRAVAVVKDSRGVLRAVIRHPIDADRSDLILVDDSAGAPWTRVPLGRAAHAFVRVELVVAVDGTALVGAYSSGDTFGDGQLELYRRRP